MEYKLKKNYQPFIGFEFDGIYSEDLGIKRVSSGNRYNIFLKGEEQVYSNDSQKIGINFFKSDRTIKKYSLNIAFDKLTEANFNKMRKLFDAEKQGYLILDEEPYKKIKVKCDGSNQIKWLCFMEKGQRIYKGEGTLDFTNYTSSWEWVSPYLDYYYDNIDNSAIEISQLERYNELFAKTNLFFPVSGQYFNKELIIDSRTNAKYCFITPSLYGKSFPIFYLHFTEEGKNLIKNINFVMGNNSITSQLELILDDYLKIDLHNKTMQGMVLNEDNQLIYSGNDYSHLLNYSKLGGELQEVLFGKTLFTPTELVIKDSIDKPLEYRIFLQVTDEKGYFTSIKDMWQIEKVEYENLL